MGEHAHGHARVETRVLKTPACRGLLSALADGAYRFIKERACRKHAFKHSYAVNCVNRSCVGVRAENASASGSRVGPSQDKTKCSGQRKCLWTSRLFRQMLRPNDLCKIRGMLPGGQPREPLTNHSGYPDLSLADGISQNC